MLYLFLKSLHIIFIVTWFAGLFYIVRLFIYHVEALEKSNPEKEILIKQFKIMQKRLWYGITWPSMLLTLVFGFWLVYELNYWRQPWMILKFSLVFGLVLYHLQCHRIFDLLKKDIISLSSMKLRLWNEIATLFLVAIIFTVVFKNSLNWMYGGIGILLFALLMLLFIRQYKKRRGK